MNRTLAAIACSLLISCDQNHTQETQHSSNPDVPVDLVLSKDGYRVYRFRDGGRERYFVIPDGRVEWDHTEHHGKSSTVTIPESVDTVSGRGDGR